ncbi:DUF6440 family protein [Clostridium sp.]|uniref:DUF6440 family protein n=1 Tax=Clostridium sp. TaxID=1506 RepID=UPI001A537D24|nr:DUF6440 family protein [Clostridium sp.]MBK5235856.1 hypothetical protein [Clostridium sp.]
MFNKNDNSENKKFKLEYDNSSLLTVCCKKIIDTKTGTNYLINIEDYAGGLTVLLDKDGNAMLSQVKL